MSKFTNFIFGRDRQPKETPRRPTITQNIMSGYYQSRRADVYRNLFPYIDARAQQFAQLTPYAIDANGEKLASIPAPLAAWHDPNPDDSGRQWARNLAASVLCNSHTDILVITTDATGAYDPFAQPTGDNINGYIMLPPSSRRYTGNGDFTCSVRLNIDGQTATIQADRSHILSFTYAQHPAQPSIGVSPASVAEPWATVDDLVADYERGFFENNAIPAGIMHIVSEDGEDFQRSVQHLEAETRGAGKNNGVIYVPKFIDPATGKPLTEAKVTFIPFQQANDTLDIKTLTDVVDERMANALNVPDIIRGIDKGQTYANAEQAYRNFITFTLRPFAVNIYDQLMHELQRITGGALDWTISFDLQEPADTDQQKTAAEANQLNTSAFAQLINLGATPAQAAAALGLPDEWAELTAQPTAEPTTASASYAAGSPLSVTRRTAQSAARRICRKAFNRLLEQAKSAGQYAATDQTRQLADATAQQLYAAYQLLMSQAADKTGGNLHQQLRKAAATSPAIAALLASTPNVYLDAQARAAWLQHLAADCYNSFTDAQAHITAMLEEDDGDDTAARRYLNHTRTPLLADNETVLSERNGRSVAAAAIAAHYSGVAQVVKTWQTRDDDDVCEECAAMEGTTVPASASFGAACEYDGVPSCHPNCRCYAVYSIKTVE